MSNSRSSISETLKNHLLDEVHSLCPICGTSLLPATHNTLKRIYEIAHIYPLNPTKEQAKALPYIQMLGDDINGIDNLLAVCPKCHTEYDKYFSVDEYNRWKNIKVVLKNKRNIKNIFSKFNIEEEIIDIIESLSLATYISSLDRLDYKMLRVDDKINNSVAFIIRKKIKDDIVDYFKFIQRQFIDINKENSFIFDTIASQIKSFYMKCAQEGFSQEAIYNMVSDWLDNKTGYKSKRACDIVVAFFIQDCEIYS